MRCLACLPLLKNLLGIIGAALLALGLTGCSTLRLAYEQAPRAAYWYLDDYLDFSAAQRPAVKAALQELGQWHRHTQLPAYLETLQKIQRQLPQTLAPAQACALYAEVQARLLSSLEGLVGFGNTSGPAPPASAALLQALTTLERGQLMRLEREFAKSNRKYRQDYVDGPASRLQAQRLAQAISRAETLYGPLSAQQEALLEARLDQSGFEPELAYAERLRRQQDTLQALRAGAASSAPASPPLLGVADSANRLGAALGGVFARAAFSPEPRQRDHAQRLTQQNCQTLAELHNSTSAAQRGKALTRLQAYEQDLRALMRPE